MPARVPGTGVVEVRVAGGGFAPRWWAARPFRFDNGVPRGVLMGHG